MSKLRNSIAKHLNTKGHYEEDVDGYLVDMILDNIKYAEESKKDLDENGVITSSPSGNGFSVTKMNPAFGIFQMCQRNIHQAASKLGLNRKDRLMLKIIEQKQLDEMDKEMEEHET